MAGITAFLPTIIRNPAVPTVLTARPYETIFISFLHCFNGSSR